MFQVHIEQQQKCYDDVTRAAATAHYDDDDDDYDYDGDDDDDDDDVCYSGGKGAGSWAVSNS